MTMLDRNRRKDKIIIEQCKERTIDGNNDITMDRWKVWIERMK